MFTVYKIVTREGAYVGCTRNLVKRRGKGKSKSILELKVLSRHRSLRAAHKAETEAIAQHGTFKNGLNRTSSGQQSGKRKGFRLHIKYPSDVPAWIRRKLRAAAKRRWGKR